MPSHWVATFPFVASPNLDTRRDSNADNLPDNSNDLQRSEYFDKTKNSRAVSRPRNVYRFVLLVS